MTLLKYLIAIADGCADQPILSGQTPLQYAHTPCLNRLAAHSQVGRTNLIPSGCPVGSQTALLTLLGAPVSTCHGGRAALEAHALGVPLDADTTVLRCNLVTLDDDRLIAHDGSGVTQTEADALLLTLQQQLGDALHTFHIGHTYRALLLRRGFDHPGGAAPDTLLGAHLCQHLPDDADLQRLFFAARDILTAHPVNQARQTQGLPPVNGVWFWGGGHLPTLPDFTAQTGLHGGAVGGVALVQGIARASGLHWLDVAHADGSLYTNWEGKAFAAFDALTRGGLDFVLLHVEAPDEAGHSGNLPHKVASIEYFDQRFLAPLTSWLDETQTDYRLLVLSDHPTPLALRRHTTDPVPWLLYDSRHTAQTNCCYDEAHTAGCPVLPGRQLLNLLLERKLTP